MKTIIFLFLLVATAYCQQDFVVSGEEETSVEVSDPLSDTISAIMTYVLNSPTFQNKLKNLWDLIDLKIRFVRFVSSILTQENLILFRRALDVMATGNDYLRALLPEAPPADPLGALFPNAALNSPENPVNQINEDNEFLPSDLFSATEPAPTAPVAPPDSVVADDNNISNAVRVDRSAKLTEAEEKDIVEHRNNILRLANLIYKSRQ